MATQKTPASTSFPKQTPAADLGKAASDLIDARLEELGDWRGALLSQLRALIRSVDPDVIEEWKWNIPVWSCAGILCTGETYKKAVKLTFPKGAALPDPDGLFNSSLEGNTRRAIDFPEGCLVHEAALKELIRQAIALNRASTAARPSRKKV